MSEYDGAERSTTEHLRQLLDARGVEWGRLVDSYGIIGTFWWDSNNDQCSALEGADDIPIGKLSVQANLTPEQAVEATLGRGTCRIDYHFGEWYCTGCGEMVGTCDTTSELCIDGNAIELWSYCPNCGRRVEE